jgi:hypothetical protein
MLGGLDGDNECMIEGELDRTPLGTALGSRVGAADGTWL